MNNLEQQTTDFAAVLKVAHVKKLTKFTSYKVASDFSVRIDTKIKASKDRPATSQVTTINYLPLTIDDWLGAGCETEQQILARGQLLATYLTDTAVILAKDVKVKMMFSFEQVLELMRDVHKLDVAASKISLKSLQESGFIVHLAAMLDGANVAKKSVSIATILKWRDSNADFAANEQKALDLEAAILAISENSEVINFVSSDADIAAKYESSDFIDSVLAILAKRYEAKIVTIDEAALM